ncbi:MAG: D-alanyl-D-alanine carboxypeptidase [Xanthobacteraceae bacterium]
MGWVRGGADWGLRGCVLAIAAVIAALTIGTSKANAWHHRHYGHHSRRTHRSAQAYSPPAASIVIDGNTGAVLEASNAEAARHPASLTKVMTLYLLFEQLKAGRIRLDTQLSVSAHAAAQAPTKLSLKPGETITVEDAIKGIVTRSANDAAVVIAENLGGSEDAFARLMTQQARALGMSHTTYVNASGLPDDDQVTSARDLAILGRAIYDRFPGYYRYFSTTSFVFRGRTIRGHNHLLGSVPGVDGIKTGFTDSSGFNLMTSVHRDGRYIVGVVLGGRSASERDAHMRALIEANIRLAAAHGAAVAVSAAPTAARSAALSARTGKILTGEFARATRLRAAPVPPSAPTPNQHIMIGSSDPIRPVVVRTLSFRTVTVRAPSMRPMPILVPVTQSGRSAQFARVVRPTQAAQEVPVSAASAAPMPPQPPQPAAPSHTLIASAGPLAYAGVAPQSAAPAASEPEETQSTKIAGGEAIPNGAPHVRSGWVIQIGAYGGVNEAREHLSAAQDKLRGEFTAADPFTEPVQKGDTTLYRARFAGFDRATAEAACRRLRRSDFACITLRN